MAHVGIVEGSIMLTARFYLVYATKPRHDINCELHVKSYLIVLALARTHGCGANMPSDVLCCNNNAAY